MVNSATNPQQTPRILALAGGVGGAKLADGLAQSLPATSLSVIVNIGDDFDHYGLRVCPDLDTVCYTLAGIANPDTGWGREGESWEAFTSLSTLGGQTWFRLGDRDLGTHLERTRRLRDGELLSEITRSFCEVWQIEVTVLPATDARVPTMVRTLSGELEFQDYFVRLHCEPEVTGFRFDRAEFSKPADGVVSAIKRADLVIINPSNPWVSIDPILAIPGIRENLAKKNVVAVSPIIGGKALKGPAAKMFREMGIEPSPLAVATHYGSFLTGFIIDDDDEPWQGKIRDLGMKVLQTNTKMITREDRSRLANAILDEYLG